MLDFIFNYGWLIILALVFAFGIYRVYKAKGKEAALQKLREQAYKLMLAAEKRYGQGTGNFKFNYVVEKLYPRLPRSMLKILSKEDVEVYVQEWYNKAKDYLDNGENDNSIEE